jgi:hypothetical protein
MLNSSVLQMQERVKSCSIFECGAQKHRSINGNYDQRLATSNVTLCHQSQEVDKSKVQFDVILFSSSLNL